MRNCFLEDACQVSWVFHGPAAHAKGVGDGGVIRAIEIDIIETFAKSRVLPGLDPSIGCIGKDDRGYRQIVARDRIKLATGKALRAVAHDREHFG